MKWSKEKIDYIREHYPDEPTEDVARTLGISARHLVRLASRHKIRKTKRAKIRANSGMFKKGHVSHNKGRPQKEWCSEEGLAKIRKTHFKVGKIPPTYRPVGSEWVRPDTDEVMVKVSDEGGRYDRWMLKKRLVWEKHNGPVNEGHIIAFKDGNNRNFDISNLECISREERCKIILCPDPDIQSLRGLMGVLAKQINKTHIKQ